MHLNRPLLAETPATADGLVIRLEGVCDADERHACAVLPVHPMTSDAWLRDKYANASMRKIGQPTLLVIRIVGTANLDRVWNLRAKRVGLGVKVAPNNPRLPVGIDDARAFFRSLGDASPARIAPFG